MLKIESPTRPKTIADLVSDDVMARIGGLDLASRKIFRGKLQGERRSKKRGESVEFADHRPYVVGDDLRHIDWNVYGRLDHLFMKLFLEDEDLSLHIVIDASLSSDCGEPSKLLFMQKAAMALGYVGLVNLNRVTATAIGGVQGGVISAIRDLRGRRRTQDLARWICTIEPTGILPFTESCKRIAMSRRGRGIMIVMSDFFIKEGYEDGLRMLAGHGYDVFALQVLSPQEVDPTGPNGIAGDLRLRDVEDEDFAEITVSAPLLKRYKATLDAYRDNLRTFCARREIMHMTTQSDMPIDTLLVDSLRRKGVLK
ncbi:MAG: DUF58 domain-containing protein [Phycisphaeraceae bacterium]|nr:DUF58 domain-containing protein [Phycisphaerales bacterium]MCB9860609.1 DUF58 domain-containing protein [Phycisphaeraceae bacterium]